MTDKIRAMKPLPDAHLHSYAEDGRNLCSRDVENIASELLRARTTIASLTAEVEALTSNRDMWQSECESISKEWGLPPGIRPAEGELRRMLEHHTTLTAEVGAMRASVIMFRDAILLALGLKPEEVYHWTTTEVARAVQEQREALSRAIHYVGGDDIEDVMYALRHGANEAITYETTVRLLTRVTAERDEAQAQLAAELPAAWREDLASLNECVERLTQERDAAQRLLQEARDVLALCTTRTFPTPEDDEVRRLGERIGFGALMTAASKGWADVLRERHPEAAGGQYTCGPCEATVHQVLAKMDGHLGGGK